MSENEDSRPGPRPVECFPANNLEGWSPIPKADRVAVKRALAGLRAPMGDGPLQRAVTALGAAHMHLVRSTLAGYVEMGLWLYTLWTHTPTRQWLRCFSDSPNPITHPLPLSRQQVEAFMRLAREPALLDQANWSRLPRGWPVMDAILRAAKRRRHSVQAVLDSGTIHPA